MATLNYCVDEGAIVGTALALPSSADEYQWKNRQPAVGCNHLWCPLCYAKVRNQAGLFLAVFEAPREQFAALVEALHATEDWSTFPGVTASPASRLYACKCYYQSENGWTSAFDMSVRDMNDEPMRSLPWQCAGHSPAVLPLRRGEILFEEHNLQTGVARIAKSSPSEVIALRQLTRNGPSASAVEVAIVRALVDVDSETRSAMLHLLWNDPSLVPVERVATLLASNDELFRGARFPAPFADGIRDQRDALAAVLGKMAMAPGADLTRLVPLLRSTALAGGVAAVIAALAAVDGAWLVGNATALAAKQPVEAGAIIAHTARVIMRRTFDEAMLRDLARAVASAPGVDRRQAAARLVRTLGDGIMQVPGGWGPLLKSAIES